MSTIDKINKLEKELEELKTKCDCKDPWTPDHKIVRSNMAGVFFGKVISEEHHAHGLTVIMENARRIFWWAGAASLSELAMCGTKKPDECQFPIPIKLVKINGVNEILDTTEKAKISIDNVPIWTA